MIEKVIGQNIARARHSRGLTQMAMAVYLNQVLGKSWSPSAVSQAEKGRRKFTAEELYALGLILGGPKVDVPKLIDSWFREGP